MPHVISNLISKLIGQTTCRLQFNNEIQAQIRFMAVTSDWQGKGVGKELLHYLEQKAKSNGSKIIILQSRDKAVPFYQKCGFRIQEKTFLMWGEIQHYLMIKELD